MRDNAVMDRLLAIGIGSVLASGVSVVSADSPSMVVSVDATAVADYVTTHPGKERRWRYHIENTSPSGDGFDMTRWEVGVGTENGVLRVEADRTGRPTLDHFLFAEASGFIGILPSQTLNDANRGYVDLFTPAELGAVVGEANAEVSGSGGDEQFPQVSVDVPGIVGLIVTEISVEPGSRNTTEVTLKVEATGGRFWVEELLVEFSAKPEGPWSGISTIPGDGTTYAGVVYSPHEGIGFVRARVAP